MSYRIIKYSKSEAILPDNYSELEYISDTGNASILTDVQMTPNMSVETNILVASNGNRWCYGSSQSGKNYTVNILSNTSLEVKMGNGSYGWQSVVVPNLTQKRYTIKSTATQLFLDDIAILTFSDEFTEATTDYLNIGARVSGNYNTCFIGNYYSFKIYNGTEIYRNFIPAKRKSDDKVGFYEMETNTFYYSTNSRGQFVAGPIKNRVKEHQSLVGLFNDHSHNLPTGYEERSFIKANDRNVQLAIPLNFSLDNTCKIETKMNVANDGGTFLYGARIGFGVNAFACFDGWAPFGSDGGSGYVSIGTNIDYVIEQSQDGIFVNGSKNHDYTPQTFDTTVKCAIFNCTQGTDGSYYRGTSGIVTCYYFKVWRDGTPIFEGYPALRQSDQMPGIYDIVQQQFFCCANPAYADKYVLGSTLKSTKSLSCLATEDN